MVNAPIVPVRDGDEVEQALRDYYEAIFTLLGVELAAKGISLPQLRRRAETEHPELAQQFRERRAGATRTYLAPNEDSTLDDVVEAMKLLTPPVQLKQKKKGFPPRNRLLAVQIAIWRDSLGLPVPKIADTLGWDLREDEHGTRRLSDRVSDHAKLGRQLLQDLGKDSADFGSVRK